MTTPINQVPCSGPSLRIWDDKPGLPSSQRQPSPAQQEIITKLQCGKTVSKNEMTAAGVDILATLFQGGVPSTQWVLISHTKADQSNSFPSSSPSTEPNKISQFFLKLAEKDAEKLNKYPGIHVTPSEALLLGEIYAKHVQEKGITLQGYTGDEFRIRVLAKLARKPNDTIVTAIEDVRKDIHAEVLNINPNSTVDPNNLTALMAEYFRREMDLYAGRLTRNTPSDIVAQFSHRDAKSLAELQSTLRDPSEIEKLLSGRNPKMAEEIIRLSNVVEEIKKVQRPR